MRRFKIDAGHRVHNHQGKCASVHGHEYKFLVYAHAEDLDSMGMVIDFAVLKNKIGAWLDNHWDHGMLIWREDPNAYLWNNGGPLFGHKVFYTQNNPTAENLASELLRISNELMTGTGILIRKIGCWETENSYAEASL